VCRALRCKVQSGFHCVRQAWFQPREEVEPTHAAERTRPTRSIDEWKPDRTYGPLIGKSHRDVQAQRIRNCGTWTPESHLKCLGVQADKDPRISQQEDVMGWGPVEFRQEEHLLRNDPRNLPESQTHRTKKGKHKNPNAGCDFASTAIEAGVAGHCLASVVDAIEFGWTMLLSCVCEPRRRSV